MPEARSTPTPIPIPVSITWASGVTTVTPPRILMPCGTQAGPPSTYKITWTLTGNTFGTKGVQFNKKHGYATWPPAKQPIPGADNANGDQTYVAEHKVPYMTANKTYTYSINYPDGSHFDPEAEDEAER